ncbi:Domain of unknown function DUF4098 [Ostreococcus tauri]|uniref:Adhesin domain-containing protein n=1 Tax=Ostreococcus tauri TaxID=70448 RepID=A0A090M653_OSTTA|nr:Domain of unknown function DUF4098 [Ostreococcus tauri]CEF98157.1 Domain of unknown function DUF4098 [Ostreococcus tauri]|eukprot:XP_022839112.1 Domain of unknown function DUF4098 [Ostreococcus tauri]
MTVIIDRFDRVLESATRVASMLRVAFARVGLGRHTASRARWASIDARDAASRATTRTFGGLDALRLRFFASRILRDVAPGSTIRVESAMDDVTVEVVPATAPGEEMEVEVTMKDGHGSAADAGARAEGVGDLGDGFDVRREGERGEIVVVTDGRIAGTSRAVTIRATIPPRFCGVDAALDGRGSSVFVESVVEAGLKLRTNGGDVGLGTIKGSIMDVETRGGSVRARSSVSADSRVQTQGGDVIIGGKLVGSVVYVDTETDEEGRGGKFQVEAVFADKINVNTGGGAVAAKSVRVGEFGLVRSGGGDVVIGALEGAGDEMIGIDSGGGSVDVAFAERVHIAHVSSRGGAIEAAFPSGFSPFPHVVGVHNGVLVDDIVTLPNPAIEHPRGVRIVHDDTDVVARKVAAGSEGASVVLDARAGPVRLRADSWFARAVAGLTDRS